MNLQDAIDKVAEKFVYTNDPGVTKDAWFVMREIDGKYHGDCEDFSLTAYWFFSGQSLIKFLWCLLVTRSYGLWFVKSDGSDKVNHCVAEMNGVWFDNWTKRALSEQEFFAATKHGKGYKAGRTVTLGKLIIGMFYRNSYK